MKSTLSILFLFCASSLNAAAPAITPEQEQAAIKEVREKVPKNREEDLRKMIPADWSKLPNNLNVLPAALAALRLNVDVEQANQALQKHAEKKLMGGIPEFYPMMQMYAQIYYLFNSKSSFFPGRLTPQTEAAMKAQMWVFVQRFKVDDVSQADPLQIINTENHDFRGRSSLYLYSAVLKDDPAYRDRKYEDGHTAAEHYAAMNEFYKRNLKAKALNGLWYEIGSPQYAKHSWPVLLVLADVAPDETVRRYAKMLLDLAWVENSELSFGYTRLGGTLRGPYPGTYISHFAPLLFGEEARGGSFAASDYQVPDIAILLHRFGSDQPPCEIINKVLSTSFDDGKIAASPILNYTYKTPRYALGGLMFNPAEKFCAISTDRRIQKLVFNDDKQSGVSLFQEAGGKFVNFWLVQHKNVMVGQKFISPQQNKIVATILPGPEIEEVDGWVFVKRGDAFAAVRPAYGGYMLETPPNPADAKIDPAPLAPVLDNVAAGGKAEEHADNANAELNQLGLAPSAVQPPAPSAPKPKKVSDKGGVVRFNDEWVPIILHAGDIEEFGSYDRFKEKILKAELKVTDDAVIYKGPGQPIITFYHKQLDEMRAAMDAGNLKMPEIDGKPVDLDPPLAYNSPYMSSVPGTEKVRTSFGSLVKEYDFGK